MEISDRRRWRRRESQRLSHRTESRTHDSQRREQPNALPGRLGRGKIKHSLTYSGGLSRSYTRTYAPAHHFGFRGFSPNTRPSVIGVAEAIPFIQLTNYDVDTLYALKGEIVSRGVAAVTGMKMPAYPKRRFQHGALPEEILRRTLPFQEAEYRRQFL